MAICLSASTVLSEIVASLKAKFRVLKTNEIEIYTPIRHFKYTEHYREDRISMWSI